MKTKNKTNEILKSLLAGEKLSVLSSLRKHKTHKLSTRVSEFRAKGISILDKWEEKNGTKYKVYWLGKISKEQRQALNYYVKLNSKQI